MPNGPLAHVCLLVEDLDTAIEDWTKLLGVLDPDQLEETLVRYDAFEAGDDRMRWATFVANHGCEIQLMEPAPDTPLGRRLAKHGESVHHICFTTDDVEATMTRLAEAGLAAENAETYGDPAMPWQKWAWVTPKAAHGVLVEVAKPYRAAHGKWQPAGEPEGAA